jgi:hypothetical protein
MICSTLSPAPIFSRMLSTVMRVPDTTGFPSALLAPTGCTGPQKYYLKMLEFFRSLSASAHSDAGVCQPKRDFHNGRLHQNNSRFTRRALESAGDVSCRLERAPSFSASSARNWGMLPRHGKVCEPSRH